MAKIKKIITAQEREQIEQKEVAKQVIKDELKDKFSRKIKLSQEDINQLVLLLAEERGLI